MNHSFYSLRDAYLCVLNTINELFIKSDTNQPYPAPGSSTVGKQLSQCDDDHSCSCPCTTAPERIEVVCRGIDKAPPSSVRYRGSEQHFVQAESTRTGDGTWLRSNCVIGNRREPDLSSTPTSIFPTVPIVEDKKPTCCCNGELVQEEDVELSSQDVTYLLASRSSDDYKLIYSISDLSLCWRFRKIKDLSMIKLLLPHKLHTDERFSVSLTASTFSELVQLIMKNYEHLKEKAREVILNFIHNVYELHTTSESSVSSWSERTTKTFKRCNIKEILLLSISCTWVMEPVDEEFCAIRRKYHYSMNTISVFC